MSRVSIISLSGNMCQFLTKSTYYTDYIRIDRIDIDIRDHHINVSLKTVCRVDASF